MTKASTKQFFKAYRKRRFNTRFEVRKQLRLRNNLEKQFYRQILAVFNKNGDTFLSNIATWLQFDVEVNSQRLGNDLF